MWWILLRKLRWVYTRSIPRRQSPSIFARCFNFNKKGIGKGEEPPVDNMRTSPERKEKKKRHGNSVTTTGFESSRKDTPAASLCVLCKGKHSLATCKNFLERPFKARLELCVSRGICFSCLSQGHTARSCKEKTQCEVCKKPHTTALHCFSSDDKTPRKPSKPRTIAWTVVILHATSLILPVWIHHRNDPDRQVKAYAVLDDQWYLFHHRCHKTQVWSNWSCH